MLALANWRERRSGMGSGEGGEKRSDRGLWEGRRDGGLVVEGEGD